AYNPKLAPYNAKGDARSSTIDVQMTMGVNTVTSAGLLLSSPADLNKTCIVAGAGVGGADLITTVSGISGNVATLALSASTTVPTGTGICIGTDDTLALLACIADAEGAVGHGSIYLPN